MHPRRILIAAAALVAAPLTMGAGCGSSGPAGGPHTQVAIKGNPAAPDKCTIVLAMPHPVNKQLVATLTVSCNFPAESADLSLVIQGRHIGAGDTGWDNLSDPKRTVQALPATLTYTVPCITALEYQASASLDTLAPDGTPVHDDETTTPRSYDASECS